MTPRGNLTRALITGTALALVLTGCTEHSDDDAANGQIQQVEDLLETDARGDQRAAGGATAMAVELGFEQVQTATEQEITAVRDNAAERSATATELDVDPAQCSEAIAALDWSPILADSEGVTRVDFSTGAFQGAGSIEVAGTTEDTGGSEQAAEQVAAHQQAVTDITGQCSDLRMHLADESEPDWAELEYTFTAEPVETDAGTGLRWQRYPTEEPDAHATAAISLLTEHEGYAIMVAFIGGAEITDDEFTDISDAILAAAIAQLD